jgi:hypothetical protein
MLDENSDPWLIEVNCMPSLAGCSDFDTDLKTRVIAQTLRILDLRATFKSDCEKRLKSLSTSKPDAPGAVPWFDPQRESEIAQLTEWEQLLPVVNDPEMESLCARSLAVVADRPQAPARSRVPAKKPLISVAQSVPSVKKLQAPPKTFAEAIPKAAVSKPVKLLQRTPRSVALADAARSVKIDVMDRRLELGDAFPVFSVFVGSRGHNPICDAEERDRLLICKRQSHLAAAVFLPQRVSSLFRDGKTALFDEVQKMAVRKSRLGKLAAISLSLSKGFSGKAQIEQT